MSSYLNDDTPYAAAALGVDEIEELTPEGYKRKRKRERYERLRSDAQWWQDFSACNLWTAAFFTSLTEQNLQLIPTTEALRRFLREGNGEWRIGNSEKSTPHSLLSISHIIEEANKLAQEHRFFHWPLEFPEVFGGVYHGFNQAEHPRHPECRLLSEIIAVTQNIMADHRLVFHYAEHDLRILSHRLHLGVGQGTLSRLGVLFPAPGGC